MEKKYNRARPYNYTKKRRLYQKMSIITMASTIVLGAFLCGMLQERSVKAFDLKPETKVITVTSTEHIVEYMPPSKDVVVNEIIDRAREYEVSVIESLEVAKCESGYNAFAKAKGSSAKGVFQFINKTWTNYCDGDVYDYKDNIKCFMELYPEHKSWWECAK